ALLAARIRERELARDTERLHGGITGVELGRHVVQAHLEEPGVTRMMHGVRRELVTALSQRRERGHVAATEKKRGLEAVALEHRHGMLELRIEGVVVRERDGCDGAVRPGALRGFWGGSARRFTHFGWRRRPGFGLPFRRRREASDDAQRGPEQQSASH